MKSIEELTKQGIVDFGNLSRMTQLIQRAEAGESLVIGFLGGSITQGCLSSTPETCYAYLVYQWWVQTFPNATFTYVNAGIGGTTSYYGVSRVQEHLLAYEPDFVITEFSVNDEANEFFEETYEGLLRKILFSPSKPALMIINNLFYQNGHNAQQFHNRIAKEYELPVFSVRDAIYSEIVENQIVARDLTSDDLHPNDNGHLLISQMISCFLNQIKERNEGVMDGEKIAPITQNRFEQTVRLQNHNSTPSLIGFTSDLEVQNSIGDNFKKGWYASLVGEMIIFDVECSTIGVQYRKTINRPAPIAKMIIDENEEQSYILDSNFSETWGDCLALDFIQGFEQKAKHQIKIEIIHVDKENNTPFYLVGLIVT